MDAPHSMARLAQTLCGMYDAADGQMLRLPQEQVEELKGNIAGILGAIVVLRPDILSSEPVAVDNDWGLEPYVADPRLKPIIEGLTNVHY